MHFNSGGRAPGSKLPASPPPLPRPDGGGTPGRVPVYTAQKSLPVNRRTAPVELHNRDIDHLCSSTTATIALQLELKVVVVVGANNVNAAEPAIQHAKKKKTEQQDEKKKRRRTNTLRGPEGAMFYLGQSYLGQFLLRPGST